MQKNTPTGKNEKKGYSGVSNEDSGILGKIRSIKNAVLKGKDEGSEGNDQPTSSNDLNQPKTWKDKVQDKIIQKVEIKRNILAFLGLFGTGCGLVILSLFLLPLIIIRPHKFCMCFAFGGLLITFSFIFLRGTANYVKSLCAKDRYIITMLYFGSIILGIGFSLGKRYILSILCAIYQCVALVLFILTFVPGGKVGIDCIKKAFTSPFTRLFAGSISSQMDG